SDDRADSPPVTIVSQSFARAISPDGHPLGRRVTMPFHRNGQPPIVMDVIGVVPDVITNVSTLEPLSMYFPMAQTSVGSGRTIVVRAAGSVEAARRGLADVLRQMGASVTPGPIMTLREQIGREMSVQRFGATVLGALGAIAMLLTIVGAYVLAESMAVLRMREMGIRAALGATRLQLARLVLGQSTRLVGAGALCGFALAWAGARMIRAFLFRVQPLDPVTLGGVALLILILAIVVSLRPAIRVGRLDLAAVLKQE
ncbi:MAG TPA: FtsX-like permease family protein, partial [Vicinamibacterales bacterium]